MAPVQKKKIQKKNETTLNILIRIWTLIYDIIQYLKSHLASFWYALRCVHSVVGLHMASLQELLQNAGVQDTFIDKLSDDGWTIELFAMAAPNLDRFDELKSMLGDLFDITTAVQRSAIRLAWTRCQSSQSVANPPSMPYNPSPNEAGPVHASWSETFPPKLTAQVVSEMKQRFKKNYPAEILLPETTPSLRLLSLVHHQKQNWNFDGFRGSTGWVRPKQTS